MELEKKSVKHGISEAVFKQYMSVVAWKDNKAVYASSNGHSPSLESNCTHYSLTERKKINVPQPTCIKKYNTFMGGVDLLDAMTAVYRVRYRSKKWWWPFYASYLSVSCVNAWRLHMQTTGIKESYLDLMALVT